MASTDPLDLLRQSIATPSLAAALLTDAGAPADALPDASSFSFPQPDGKDAVIVPKDAPTRYARTDARDDFYSVGQLWLAWTERDTGVREYLMKGQAAGVGYVAITDRRGVVDFLQGSSDGGVRVLGKGEDPKAAAAAAPAADTAAAPASAEAGPSRSAPAAKRKYEVNIADRDFCKKLRAEEVELKDRNTVLRVSSGGKVNNFSSFVQTVMNEKIRASQQALKSGRSQPQQPVAADPSRNASRQKRSAHPIILISSSPTSLLTMWNVKKFLEQGIFEPSETARQNEMAQGNIRSEDMIPILRKRSSPTGETQIKYYVVDSVEALQKFGVDAWDRVICVVTTGQAWQFKPYKWMDPKVLFRNVNGAYFQWHNEATNPTIKDWNVTDFKIDKFKRHTDRQVVAKFWNLLDSGKRR
ncbi:Cell division control protein 73 [Vanrija pseudolonga]|uniref:Cell division control protein 73 n=1 Tax=Vanrija pseudolonga TaxID=143232 RepID=A0AAF1BF56_9TREE|nr:Cell division control protein 73 [Vanrija pseudolonga]